MNFNFKLVMNKTIKLGSGLFFLLIFVHPLFPAMEGDFEFTVQGARKEKDSSKFDEYRTVPEGAYVESFRFKSQPEDASNCYLNIQSIKPGLEDQNILLKGGKYGVMELGFKYDQSLHKFSNTGKSLYVHDGGGYFGFSNQLQTDLQTSTNNAPSVFSDVPAIPLQLRRDLISADIRLSPMENLTLKFTGSNEDRNGSRPIGIAFGYGSLVEVPEPISYKTQKAGFIAQMNQGNFNTIFSYEASLFKNDIDAIVADNPWRRTDGAVSASGASTPDRARFSLPPDNHAHQFNFGGGVNIPIWQSRLNASLSYGIWRQNDTFLPPTINQAILARAQTLGVNINPPRSSLDGKMNVLSANSSLSMRPLQPLLVSGKMRYYKLENKTEEMTMEQYIPYDSTSSTSTPKGNFNPARQRKSLAIGYTKLSAGTDASYQILKSFDLNLGYEWEKITRTHREVENSYEHTFKSSLNFVLQNWIQLRPNYLHANRYHHHYNAEEVAEETYPIGEGINALGNLPLLRKFDEANRLRDITGIKTMIFPFDVLTLAAEYSYRVDDYNGTSYGVKKDKNHSVSFDVTYDLAEFLTFFGNFGREENTLEMKSRYRASGNATTAPTDFEADDWLAVSKDITDTFGIGGNGVISKDKLFLDADYNFSRSKGELRANNPSTVRTASALAVDFPQTKTELHKVNTSLKWRFMENLTAKLSYQYEKYLVEDFAFETIQPWQTAWPQSVFLDATQGDVDAHIAGLSLSYKF